MDKKTPIVHIASRQEIDGLTYMGIKVSYGKIDPVIFINEHFPGLNIGNLALNIIAALTTIATPPTEFSIELKEEPFPTISLSYADSNGDHFKKGLMLSRKFINVDGEISAQHEYFTLPEIHRKKGTGTRISALLLQEYLNMRIKRISVFAALDGGGYTWARMGFAAVDKSEVEEILSKAEEILNGTQFAFIKESFDDFYAHNTRFVPFPIYRWAELSYMKPVLMGSMWHGELDFENPIQLRNFKSYVQ